jgi:hypothetical protein
MGLWWVADIIPGWKIAVLVLEDALEHEKFFPAACTCGEKWLSGA